jgi:broad specificity phosphatase PhoE
MSTVFLIRHGQASYQGAPLGRLTELGRRQARALGEYLAKSDKRFDACYCGALPRQTETAQIVSACLGEASGGPLRTVPELDEHDTPGIIKAYVPELATFDPSADSAQAVSPADRQAFQQLFEKALYQWVAGARPAAEIEMWDEFRDRVRCGLRQVAGELPPKAKALVVTSGGPISMAMQWALGLDGETAMRLEWRVRNTSVSLFKINSERAELLSFNSTAHLEAPNGEALLSYL